MHFEIVDVDGTWEEVNDELQRAYSLHGPMRSTHEAYGILAEEMAEFFDEVRSNNLERAIAEATQVAASAVRFIMDAKEWQKQSI